MSDLPVKKENFLAEVEVMDLSKIKNEKFLVAVSTGDPDSVKFLSSTVHGPYDFTEMLQEVGSMWQEHQHHAKVVVLDKNPKNEVRILDGNTVDYIECHYNDLITEEMLAGAFDTPKDYTCQAGLSAITHQPDPRHEKKEEDATESDSLSG
jgi:hypothetical protein